MTRHEAFAEAMRRKGYTDAEIEMKTKVSLKTMPGMKEKLDAIVPPGMEKAEIGYWLGLLDLEEADRTKWTN